MVKESYNVRVLFEDEMAKRFNAIKEFYGVCRKMPILSGFL
jgi:hypothetical protein